jgi:hypothetical protein
MSYIWATRHPLRPSNVLGEQGVSLIRSLTHDHHLHATSYLHSSSSQNFVLMTPRFCFSVVVTALCYKPEDRGFDNR